MAPNHKWRKNILKEQFYFRQLGVSLWVCIVHHIRLVQRSCRNNSTAVSMQTTSFEGPPGSFLPPGQTNSHNHYPEDFPATNGFHSCFGKLPPRLQCTSHIIVCSKWAASSPTIPPSLPPAHRDFSFCCHTVRTPIGGHRSFTH